MCYSRINVKGEMNLPTTPWWQGQTELALLSSPTSHQSCTLRKVQEPRPMEQDNHSFSGFIGVGWLSTGFLSPGS